MSSNWCCFSFDFFVGGTTFIFILIDLSVVKSCVVSKFSYKCNVFFTCKYIQNTIIDLIKINLNDMAKFKFYM